MEKRFVVINYGVDIQRNREILQDVTLRMLSIVFIESEWPHEFKIYSGRGPRGDLGLWLEFEPNKPTNVRSEIGTVGGFRWLKKDGTIGHLKDGETMEMPYEKPLL